MPKGKRVGIRFVKKTENMAEKRGFITHFNMGTVIPATSERRITLIDVLKTSVINTAVTYPFMPKVGKRVRSRIILITESAIFTLIEYSCSPRPFSIVSVTISRYIMGIRGARSFI